MYDSSDLTLLNTWWAFFPILCRGGSRGRVQGVRTPPEMKLSSSYIRIRFWIFLPHRQWSNSLEVHPLLRKILRIRPCYPLHAVRVIEKDSCSYRFGQLFQKQQVGNHMTCAPFVNLVEWKNWKRSKRVRWTKTLESSKLQGTSTNWRIHNLCQKIRKAFEFEARNRKE